ncbi:hypothetical protein DWUX_1304 [Desulfovibrio diazotrophicus]|nr:hypothetical protein DWUX_1304 [Desulfovibrio diazotrophicus]
MSGPWKPQRFAVAASALWPATRQPGDGKTAHTPGQKRPGW